MMNYKTLRNCTLNSLSFCVFTLLELLMVVSIIMILVSLLIPALQQVKTKSSELKCNGNLKQLGVAYHTYVNDYNGWLTYYYTSGCMPHLLLSYIAPSYANNNINDVLDYNIKHGGNTIYHCPSDTTNTSLSYGHNERINSGTSYIFLQKDSKVMFPSQIFNLTDASSSDSIWSGNFFSYRHHNGINYIYFDNHCSWLPMVNVMNNTVDDNNRLWGK